MPSNNDVQNMVGDVATAMTKGSLYIFIGNISGTAIMALASILIARFLGPERYGAYNLALIIPALLTGFTDLGTNAALSKFIPRMRQKGNEDEMLSLIITGLLFNIAISSVFFILLYSFSWSFAGILLNREDIDLYIRIASFIMVFQVLFITSNSVFVGLDETKYNPIIAITQAVIKLSLVLLLVSSFGIIGAIYSHVISYVVSGLLALLFCLRFFKGRSRHYTSHKILESLRSMLIYGLPLYSSLFLMSVLTRYQQIILAWYASSTELGNYYVAVNFLSFMTIVTNPISTMLLPSFSKLEEESSKIKRFLKYSVKYALFAVTPLSFLVSATSRDLVHLFYGSEYSLAPSYLTIYALIYSYIIFTLVIKNFFQGTGRVKVFLKATFIGFITAVPLTLILISQLKVIGLVTSIFISDIITFACLYHEARVENGIRISLRDPIKIFSASIFSFIVASLVDMKYPISSTIPSLVVIGIIFVFSYLISSILLGIMRREDIENLRIAFSETPISFIIIGLLSIYERIASSMGILK